MNKVESSFENHIKNVKILNLHKYVPINSESISIDEINNIIIFGAKGIGKYSQALKIIEFFSKSKLKYERKFT